MKARDIMNPNVVTVTSDMSVHEVAMLLTDNKISGVPVLEDGELVGIITEGDLVDRAKRIHIPTVFTILDVVIPIAGEHQYEEELRKMTALTAAEIMTSEVVLVEEEVELTEVATILGERHISLLPVVRDGTLVGIIGKRDVIRGMLLEGQA